MPVKQNEPQMSYQVLKCMANIRITLIAGQVAFEKMSCNSMFELCKEIECNESLVIIQCSHDVQKDDKIAHESS